MNEEEVISRLNGLLVTDFFYGGHTKTGVYWQKEVCFKEDHKFYAEAIETVLQLLDQKDKRIDDLEKALVDEAIKSKVLELYNQRINKLKDKLKKDIKNNKSGINLMDLRCIGKWQEAKEILKILEE